MSTTSTHNPLIALHDDPRRLREEVLRHLTDLRFKVGDVRKHGAGLGKSASANGKAIQGALDDTGIAIIPNGEFNTDPLLLNSGDILIGESRDSILKFATGGACIAGKNAASARLFYCTIRDLTINNTDRATASGIGIDYRNVTMGSVWNVLNTNVETGVRLTAPGGGGCYYNEFYKLDITSVDIGYEIGTLGNENKIIGGRVNDCEIGARLNDCTGNFFDSPAIEVFSSYGFDIAPTTAVQYTKLIGPRLENVPTSGTGIRNSANGQATVLVAPQFTGLTTNYSNSAKDFIILSDTDLLLRAIDSGGTGKEIKGHYSASATLDFGSIAAGATADLTITATGALTSDSVFVTPPSTLAAGLVCCGLPGAGVVTVRLANVTGAAIDPASATFRADVWRH